MAATPLKILYWCQEVAAAPFETGIPRVVRRLADQLAAGGATIIPVGWDSRSRQIRTLPTRSNARSRELDGLIAENAVLFVPEVPLTLVGDDLGPSQVGHAYGLPTAVLAHDLIPVKLAGDYPPEAVAVYRRFFRQCAHADMVFATTAFVASDLTRFFLAEDLPVPLIEVVSLPAEFPAVPRRSAAPPPRGADDPLRLVTVATWEPRKNLPRLLRAIGRATNEGGPPILLDLVGKRGGFPEYDREVHALAETLPHVKLLGQVSDAALVALYADCHASVYSSLEEGFGMPVLESLWLGRPCLCHKGSSLAEIAPGGGTMLIDMASEAAIAEALAHLRATPDAVVRLAREAAIRPLKTWSTFADEMLARLTRLAAT